MIEHWTADQWAVASVAAGLGVCAIALAIGAWRMVRGWTAPAAYRPEHVIGARPRPSIELATRRMPVAALEAHLAPGPGSLATLAEVGEGCLVRAEPVDPEVHMAFEVAFDRVMAAWRVAMEPHLRKAKRWELAGHAGETAPSARVELDHWHLLEHTGEYAMESV